MPSIRINAHSSIKITTLGGEIYVDPFMIEKDNHDAFAILITHPHYDHFSPEDINKIRKGDTLFVAPIDMKEDILKLGVKEENLFLVRKNDVVKTPFFSVKCIPSYNLKKDYHKKSAGWLGYLITVGEKSVYVLGDSDLTPEALEVKCDIALVPIGGTYTMNALEGASLVNAIKPKVAVPTHYGSIVGTFSDAETFRKNVDKDVQVKTLIKK